MNKLPKQLVYLRVVISVVLILASFLNYESPKVLMGLICVAFLSDVFDGIVARKYNCSTEKLRQMDSRADSFFWLSVCIVLIRFYPEFISHNKLKLFILICSEIAIQVFAYLKYGKSLALHTYSAKLWAVLLFFSVLCVIAKYKTQLIFDFAFYWGLISQIEVLVILLSQKKFLVDVKSLFSLKRD
ncbi:MAG: CDP-alcohol phosphatidyltransferase family protein [Bacteroidota bacterium]|jgi:CDP-diacylglycerol--glycerol-3-phosphate 3-phosphatidyltransferase|nr:CDP-alcohol phosphatidyltransferase family protein [Bacteroidota bacterium]MCA6442690.1 CDP-alcohol phosphatidyltransferase family protein [Bacteroidota bacterium]